MMFNIYLLCFIVVFFETTIAFPRYRYRYRRQIDPLKNDISSYEGRASWVNAPSGSIPGTYYYGIGSDPNYGSFISKPNTANSGGIFSISYNPDSPLSSYLINPSHQHLSGLYSTNNNNVWQRPNVNNYYNQFAHRYAPGSQGWYAVGGNYWYNNGQSIIAHPCLSMISIVILVFCK